MIAKEGTLWAVDLMIIQEHLLKHKFLSSMSILCLGYTFFPRVWRKLQNI